MNDAWHTFDVVVPLKDSAGRVYDWQYVAKVYGATVAEALNEARRWDQEADVRHVEEDVTPRLRKQYELA